MLQTQTVEPGTLSLLKELMKAPSLKDYYLVGGTALSLLYGHRISIDLDLFVHGNIERQIICVELGQLFEGDFSFEENGASWGIFCFINNIKVDIVKYPHPIIHEPQLIDGIRMYHTDDNVGMKINAILGRGKKKDFWDIAELTKHYSIDQMLALHKQKYPSQMLLISIPQALIYFDDANDSEDPISLNGQTWDGVKETIRKAVREYLS